MTFISQSAPQTQTQMTRPFSGWVEATATMVRWFIDRQATKANLEKLSEKQLRDIGLTRTDVSSIAHTHLPSSGALELSDIGKSRCGNW